MTDDVTYPTIVSTDLWGGICCFSTESDFVLLGSHGPIPQVPGWTELHVDWAVLLVLMRSLVQSVIPLDFFVVVVSIILKGIKLFRMFI